jgi:hypothetical protein
MAKLNLTSLKIISIVLPIFILIAAVNSTPINILQTTLAQASENNSLTSTYVPNNQTNNNGVSQINSPENNSLTSTYVPNNQINNVPIVATKDHSFMVWSSKVNGNSEIWFVTHINGGGFTKKINLSNSPNSESINPSITINGPFVYVTWMEEYPNGVQLPVYIQSANNGTTFGSITVLSSLPSQ